MRIAPACILGLLTICCSFASCDKPATESADTPMASTPAASTPSTDTGTPAAEPGQDKPADAGSVTAQAAATTGTKSAPVRPVDISGKWIALFGRTAGGSVVDDAWKKGDLIEFSENGGLLWTKSSNNAAVPAQYEIDGFAISIRPDDPSNIGRDDEVGLMNVGRDDEVGLLDAAPESGSKPVGTGMFRKTLFRDGNFLAVIGEHNDIMVYGKVSGSEPPRPEIRGNYTGMLVGQATVPVVFEWKENFLEGSFGTAMGNFKGQYAHGYFIGPSSNPAAPGIAAVTLLPDGTLDGVLLPMPFTSMNSNFDFRPGQ